MTSSNPAENDPDAALIDQALGVVDAHLQPTDPGNGRDAPMHRESVAAFMALRADARAAGFDLRIASGYRGFERQRRIWQAKATGERTLLDSQGEPLDFAGLTREQRLFAILRWSALPGTSRHHWGTDIDIYDAAALAPHDRVTLTPQEAAPGGPFGPLHEWLDERIAQGRAHGFFRPYARDRGGIAPERWHLSHAPVARRYARLSLDAALYQQWERVALPLRDLVTRDWPRIRERFVTVPESHYPDD